MADGEGPEPSIREQVRQRIAALEGVVSSICSQLGGAQQELTGLHSPSPGEQVNCVNVTYVPASACL